VRHEAVQVAVMTATPPGSRRCCRT
jgi:hypothetical protein